MSIHRVSNFELPLLEPLFEGWNETLIWSCLQGYMGSAWTQKGKEPTAAQLVVGDFCFFAGDTNDELIRNKPDEYISNFVIMIPQNEKWGARIEEIYGNSAKRMTRYAIKKEAGVFDTKKLTGYVSKLPVEYKLRFIDDELYGIVRQNRWSFELCSQFDTFEQYNELGLGIAVLHKGELVAGASSYSVYRNGIEVSIVTREDHRRKGLALACGARLILECLSKNLYPSWDASNEVSVRVAEKLGYHFDREYTAYFVSSFGQV